jgi:hypothetical protein
MLAAMKTQMNDTNGDVKTPKNSRQPNLSLDGKWRSFPKVPNLLQYVNTGAVYGRVKVDGKLYRESLETKAFSVAKLKPGDFVKKNTQAASGWRTHHLYRSPHSLLAGLGKRPCPFRELQTLPPLLHSEAFERLARPRPHEAEYDQRSEVQRMGG